MKATKDLNNSIAETVGEDHAMKQTKGFPRLIVNDMMDFIGSRSIAAQSYEKRMSYD